MSRRSLITTFVCRNYLVHLRNRGKQIVLHVFRCQRLNNAVLMDFSLRDVQNNGPTKKIHQSKLIAKPQVNYRCKLDFYLVC